LNRIVRTGVVTAGISILALAGAPAFATGQPASADVISQLQAMNDADCATAKAADWNAFAKTLAPEFVEIDVSGKKVAREALIADLKATPPDAKVTACSTRVDKVTREGDRYFLYGDYSEQGDQGPKHSPYRSVSRIRDTWKRVGNTWLQTESVTYEMTVWISGKRVAHLVQSTAPNTAADAKGDAR